MYQSYQCVSHLRPSLLESSPKNHSAARNGTLEEQQTMVIVSLILLNRHSDLLIFA